MNKVELVAEVAKRAGLTKVEAETAVKAVLETISSTLVKGENVQLIGFGNFVVAQKAARVGRVPSTGAQIQIPARTVPKFVPGKALKDAVNG